MNGKLPLANILLILDFQEAMCYGKVKKLRLPFWEGERYLDVIFILLKGLNLTVMSNHLIDQTS